MSTLSFRTRTKGSRRLGNRDPRIGKAFPMFQPHKRPPLLIPKHPYKSTRMPLTHLEKHAAVAEQELLKAGFKGWMITIKLKNGHIEDIPLVAKSWEQALAMARPRIHKYHSNDIDEIVIQDPSLGEILHKIGSGAVRVAKAIGRGAVAGLKGLGRLAKRGVKAFVAAAPGKGYAEEPSLGEAIDQRMITERPEADTAWRERAYTAEVKQAVPPEVYQKMEEPAYVRTAPSRARPKVTVDSSRPWQHPSPLARPKVEEVIEIPEDEKEPVKCSKRLTLELE